MTTNNKNTLKPLRVLIVEDEADLRDAMMVYLQGEGFNLSGAGNIQEARPWLLDPRGGIIVLDLGLPNGDGINGLAPLIDRQRHGLVLATARGRLEDRIRGYDQGGDAYLVKPVDLRELTSVVRGVASRLSLSRPEAETAPPGWTLSTLSWTLTSPQGNSYQLTNNELLLLQRLAQRPGQAVPREELMLILDSHRKSSYVPTNDDPRRLEILVRRLRQRATQELGENLPLQTVHGIGYAFLGDLKVIGP